MRFFSYPLVVKRLWTARPHPEMKGHSRVNSCRDWGLDGVNEWTAGYWFNKLVLWISQGVVSPDLWRSSLTLRSSPRILLSNVLLFYLSSFVILSTSFVCKLHFVWWLISALRSRIIPYWIWRQVLFWRHWLRRSYLSRYFFHKVHTTEIFFFSQALQVISRYRLVVSLLLFFGSTLAPMAPVSCDLDCIRLTRALTWVWWTKGNDCCYLELRNFNCVDWEVPP